MKVIKKYIYSLLGIALALSSCSDFDEINTNPNQIVDPSVLDVEFALHGAMVGAQQNPETAERVFVLTWKALARMQADGASASTGNISDDYMSNYYWHYLADWLKQTTIAINLADMKMQDKDPASDYYKYTNNLKQCARIWKVYILSEIADTFGAIPNPEELSQGENPGYIGAKEAYTYFLKELKESAAALDVNVEPNDEQKKYDMAYGYDGKLWKKYANSMRMRFAMRISNTDMAAEAQTHFTEAMAGGYIDDLASNFAILETGDWNTWNDLTSVMSRNWNAQTLSSTLYNIWNGLGGIESSKLLEARYHSAIKTEDYIGERYADHLPTTTNNPSAGFWFDGIPNKIDPRAYQLFIFPGDFTNPQFAALPSYNETSKQVKRDLMKISGDKQETVKTIDATLTWNGPTIGAYSTKGSLNQVYSWNGANPRLAVKFRNGSMKRIFFPSWESYFLIAEAALKGWSTPISAEEAYKKGIEESFKYNGVEQYLAEYLESENYNNFGTSVKWSHTAEPPATRTMKMKDGYTGAEGTYEFKYPVAVDTRYGKALNDQLTKVITQKYIANTPWLPLEAWSDHRRLGLPFFDTPMVEIPLTYMPALTKDNYMKQQKDFFPQRAKFPSKISSTNKEGYEQAVQSLINGKDDVYTPLWWAKQD